MGQADARIVCIHEALEFLGPCSHLSITRHFNAAGLALQQTLVTLALGEEIERALHLRTGFVQATSHFHCTLDLLRVMRIELAAIGDKARQLPAFFGILGDERTIKPQIARHALSHHLGSAIDDALRPDAGMAIHVFGVAHTDMAR